MSSDEIAMIQQLEHELAEVRAALLEADTLLSVTPDTNPDWYPSFPTRRNEAIIKWRVRYAAALKAAREAK